MGGARQGGQVGGDGDRRARQGGDAAPPAPALEVGPAGGEVASVAGDRACRA
jgi:hypothetical protein